jgi:hypothetical protein
VTTSSGTACGEHVAVVTEARIVSPGVVRATRWAHGWELHIDRFGVTQSRNLDGAEQMVRDYIESLTGRDIAAR